MDKEKRREYSKAWYRKNAEKVKKASIKWMKNNPERTKEINKKCKANNFEKYKKYQTEYHLKYSKENAKKIAKYGKEWDEKNRKRLNERKKKYREGHREQIKIINKRCYQKNKNNPIKKLNHNMSNSIGRSLKGNKNGYHWETLVNYSQEDLRKHVELQFKDGMTWDNYGKWHLDHKIPISIFNITGIKSKGFKKCWELNNLQPMWEKENISKHDKILY